MSKTHKKRAVHIHEKYLRICYCRSHTHTRICFENGRGVAVASYKNTKTWKNRKKKIEKFETAKCQNIKDVGEDNLCDLPYSMHAFYGTTQ